MRRAVMDQDVHTMAKLVRGGVNVNAINSGGYTPLGIASERGKTVAVKWLVSADGHDLFADSGFRRRINDWHSHGTRCAGHIQLDADKALKNVPLLSGRNQTADSIRA